MSPPVDPVQSDPSLPKYADVVIIGGGIIRSATAYYLVKRGMKVAIVEKGRIAAEQSSRNWGWWRQQDRDRAAVPLSQESLRIWGALTGVCGAKPRICAHARPS